MAQLREDAMTVSCCCLRILAGTAEVFQLPRNWPSFCVYGDPAIRYVHTYKGPTKAQFWPQLNKILTPQWAQFALPSRGYSGILSLNCISPKEIQRVFRFWRRILICTWCVKGTWGGWHSLLVLLFLFQYFLYQLQFASFTILRVTALSLSPLTTHSVHSIYLSFFC